jgi:hypothetical protein
MNWMAVDTFATARKLGHKICGVDCSISTLDYILLFNLVMILILIAIGLTNRPSVRLSVT